MTILITYPDRADEATREPRLAIAHELIKAGHDVDVYPCRRAPHLDEYEAVLIGSPSRRHRWSAGAVAFLRENAADLAARPTYLFQTVGRFDEPDPEPPHDLAHVMYRIGIAGPRSVHTGESEHEEAAAWGRQIARDLDNRLELLSGEL